MELSGLLKLTTETPACRRLLEDIEGAGAVETVVADAARAYLIAAVYHAQPRPMLVLTAQPEAAGSLYEQLLAWASAGRVMLLPEPEVLPYERIAADPSTEQERLRVLSALAGTEEGKAPPLVVASAPALMRKTLSRGGFTGASHSLKPGMAVDPLALRARWESIGYRTEAVVELPGTVSRRGGIVDIYPLTSELPYRLEFFGNTIESIRTLDPATQRSQYTVSSITVTPATELLAPLAASRAELEAALNRLDLSGCNAEARPQFQEEIDMIREGQRPRHLELYAPLFHRDSLLGFLPPSCLLVLDQPRSLEQTMGEFDREAATLRAVKEERGELPANFPRPYLTWPELEPEISKRQSLALKGWAAGEGGSARRLDFSHAPSYGGQLAAFVQKAKQLLAEKMRLVIVSHQARRLAELFSQGDIIVAPATGIKEVPPPGSLTLLPGMLAEGWVLANETYLFTDAEVFGFTKQRRLPKQRPVPHHKLVMDFSGGDYVVHVEHGVGRFVAITRLGPEGAEREYLLLHYAAGDKLYVPADQIDRVARYVGASDRPPTLSRLGTQEWHRTRQQAQAAAEAVAQELLVLYAAREVMPGYAFSGDTIWQQELEASFPYVETPDQVRVLAEVKGDMERTRPMDRLVCGDVGYGKTEVALRAAFKAVMDGRQVAVLAPTTVLAQQHFVTFSQRLGAFPVTIEVLSRFRTPKEQQAIIQGLAEGGIDICIGTHRLLQKDVVFKNPGLIIIDEEQRFGVTHKEHLKRLRREVDVLTLSATPIPRTLHMSLAGVRDMSTMETPPEQRLPIKTYVAPYDQQLVREVILRELERNGQVFFVHNRVQGIGYIASRLRELMPEARVAVAHGQMPEHELEAVMADFARGRSDVLVCTTIIESGLDMPNVNTLIVNKADRFGLTQLYQLRGRVGRGAHLAYAYFLYDREKRLTATAEKRLKTIYEATELGAGFNIAVRDLEIRGAGTLLGRRQSGHISAVGLSLYTRLLADAVTELKAKRAGVPAEAVSQRLPPPSLDLPLPSFIPEEYVADVDTRLSLYQGLARLERVAQVTDMAQELRDRFGPPPPEVTNLLYAVKIRVLGSQAGIESINTEGGQLVLRLFPGMKFDRHKLAPLLKEGITVGSSQLRLDLKKLGRDWPEVLERVVSLT